LWCAVDTDESDAIAQVEFGRFVKLAKGRVKYTERYVVKHGASGRITTNPVAPVEPVAHMESIEEVATDRRSLREEVEAAGFALPKEDQVSAYSRRFSDAIEKIVIPGQAKVWSTLFKDFDDDHSGLLTYEELRSGVRDRLRLRERGMHYQTP